MIRVTSSNLLAFFMLILLHWALSMMQQLF